MDNKVNICVTCPICHKEHFVEVNFDDYRRWTTGNIYVQDAFPYLNDDDRELLVTGICKKCWEENIQEEE